MFHIHNRRDSFRDNYTGLYNNPILSIVLNIPFVKWVKIHSANPNWYYLYMPPIWWVDTAILTRAVKATYGSSM